MKASITTLVFLFFTLTVYGQQLVGTNEPVGNHEAKHFRVSALMYHTYIGTESSQGLNLLIVPSLGLDVEYWFSEEWGLGLHNDMELVNFEIIKDSEVLFERETPLLFTIDGLWKPNKGWVLLFGPGIEVERNHELFVIRGGFEYEIELKNHIDISPAVFYDLRAHAYDTFSMGIGVGKRF